VQSASAGADHVDLSIPEKNIPFLINPADIVDRETAVVQLTFGGLFGRVVIGGRRSANTARVKCAYLAGRQIQAVLVHDRDLDLFREPANPARLLQPCLAGHDHGASPFARREILYDRGSKPVDHSALNPSGARRGTLENLGKGREVIGLLCHLFLSQQPDHLDGHDVGGVDTMALNVSKKPFGIKSRLREDRLAAGQREQNTGDRGGVINQCGYSVAAKSLETQHRRHFSPIFNRRAS
jgi:hypothetical protein